MWRGEGVEKETRETGGGEGEWGERERERERAGGALLKNPAILKIKQFTDEHPWSPETEKGKQTDKQAHRQGNKESNIYKQAHLRPKLNDETDVQRTKAQLHRNNYRKQNKTSK